MAGYSGPNVTDDGLVLSLDGANYKSFKGEATTNYYSTPITLTSGRTGSTDGSIKTSFNTGGPTDGPFTRVVRDTSVSRTTDWEWQIGYSGTGLSNGNSFVVSFYARCPNGTLSSVKLSNPDVEGQTFNIDSTWRRFTASFTYGAQGGLTFFRVNRGHTPFYTNGATYDIANLQVEAKSYSTSFVDGTRGSTVSTGGGWKNRTGSSDGELLNGVRESDDGGGSLVFDGTNDYVNAPVTKAASCTFSCWAKTTTVAGLPMLFNAGPSGSGPDLFFYSGSISWNTWNGNGNPFATIPSSVTDGNWHHYVVVNDASSNAKLYYDGKLLGTATYRNASANTNLTIGGNTGSYMWNGSISNFMLHNKVLTAAEVKKNFNAFRRRFGL